MIEERQASHTRNGERWPALLAAGQAGDARAYRLFLSEVSGFLRSIVLRTGIGPHSAEDVVQEALITIHAIRHTYDPHRPIKPWLTAIARRRAVDWRRKSGSVAAREIAFDPEIVATAPDPLSGAAVARIDARATVARALESLSPVQRRAVELLKLEEMALQEASRATGQSAGALKIAVHRAIRNMRAHLAAA